MNIRSWNSLSRNQWVAGGVFLVLSLLGTWYLFERDGPSPADDPTEGSADVDDPADVPDPGGSSADVEDPARPKRVALGDTLTVADASVRLHAFECGLTELPEGFSDPKGQYCALTTSVRNDGNTVGPRVSSFSWTLFVGDDEYYGDGPFVEDLFPDEEGNGTVVFDIPPRVVPSKLEVTHYEVYAEDPEFRKWELSL